MPTGPAYYARSAEFVMFFDPAIVEKHLQERFEKWHVKGDGLLLEELRHDLPLGANVDLYKYSLGAPTIYLRIDFLVASMFESGQVTLENLLYVGTGVTPVVDAAVIVTVNNQKAPVAAREFCAPNGAFLFSVVDGISD